MDKLHWRRSRSVEVGQELAYRRKAAGLNQAEVAASVGISPQQLSKYERGQSQISVVMRAEIFDFIAQKSGHDGFKEESAPPVSLGHMKELAQRAKELWLDLDSMVASGGLAGPKRA